MQSLAIVFIPFSTDYFVLLASWDIKQSLKPIITAAQVLKVEDAVDFCNRQFVHVHDRILILPTFTTFSGRE